ncbi:MAG: ABC transporter ATP-binding protein [Pseudomonadota bacterium]
MAEIQLVDVSFSYPGAAGATLEQLSLQVADGQAHALLGASGAGKTTLLNLLSGLLSPDQGRILFDGQDVSRLPGRERHVAQVFQFPVLYESMSVRANLQFPLTNARVDVDVARQRIDHVSAELGIESLLERRAGQLGLFEKQLVAVAKALVRPDVALVLLDEPLTAVEPKIKWQLRQVLRKAQADLGVTMIYVTHDQTEALTFADQVSILTAQGILQSGTPQQIYEAPAHEFVGHFVGSPGMNFVPAALFDQPQAERLGFRPEWAALVSPSAAALQGAVSRVRAQGSQGGEHVGLTTIVTQHGEVHVHGPLRFAVGHEVGIQVGRYVLFRAQQQIGTGRWHAE